MVLNIVFIGINVVQFDFNVIVNNIVNVNIIGFKGLCVEFVDVFVVIGLNFNFIVIGSGVCLQDVVQQFVQGDIEIINNLLDMVISGNGFFVVNDGSGVQYICVGDFKKSLDDYVQINSGVCLQVYLFNGLGGFDISMLIDLKLLFLQSNVIVILLVMMNFNLLVSVVVLVIVFSIIDVILFNVVMLVMVYDLQGGLYQVIVYYVKIVINVWDVYLYVDGNNVGMQLFIFDISGNLVMLVGGNFVFNLINLGNGVNLLMFLVNVINIIQFGIDYFVGVINQNGFEVGMLFNIDIDLKGVVIVYYLNNQSIQFGQIVIVNFFNVQGLCQVGGIIWVVSGDFGLVVMGVVGIGIFGDLQFGVLELFNMVDIIVQLVNMIKVQCNYQVNVQVLIIDNMLVILLFNVVW